MRGGEAKGWLLELVAKMNVVNGHGQGEPILTERIRSSEQQSLNIKDSDCCARS